MDQIKKLKVTILDGYVDEPSCLGVPPFIAPYPRYIYGALLKGGVAETAIEYYTIDQVRPLSDWYLSQENRWVIVIGGLTVPGKYLGGAPLTLKEMHQIGANLKTAQLWLMGPVVEAIRTGISGYDQLIEPLGAFEVYQYLTGLKGFSEPLLKEFAVLGATLIKKHPAFPYIINELETYRGCLRSSHCSFCAEGLRKQKYKRNVESVLAEVKALATQGATYFRLGAQPDLLAYGDQKTINHLYSGINQAAPHLKVLHLDNINPSSVLEAQADLKLKTIVKYNTEYDIASLGLESADPAVFKQNNLAVSAERCFEVCQKINELGIVKGQLKLLPGLNLLYGLLGETPKTYEINFRFLENLVRQGLLLRRINIRKVIEHGDYRGVRINEKLFRQHKELVNQEINLPLIRKIFPEQTVLKEVIPERQHGNLTFGRQLGSYSVRIGIVGKITLKKPLDVMIIGHGFRSLTALPFPLEINQASLEQLASFKGIGKKRATTIILKRPFKDQQDFCNKVDVETLTNFEQWFDFLAFNNP